MRIARWALGKRKPTFASRGIFSLTLPWRCCVLFKLKNLKKATKYVNTLTKAAKKKIIHRQQLLHTFYSTVNHRLKGMCKAPQPSRQCLSSGLDREHHVCAFRAFPFPRHSQARGVSKARPAGSFPSCMVRAGNSAEQSSSSTCRQHPLLFHPIDSGRDWVMALCAVLVTNSKYFSEKYMEQVNTTPNCSEISNLNKLLWKQHRNPGCSSHYCLLQ